MIAHRDPQATAASLPNPVDQAAYLDMLGDFARLGDVFGTVLSAQLTLPLLGRQALRVVRRERRSGTELLARDVVSSGSAFLERRFDGPEVDKLWSPWLLHTGLGPENATGGLMIPVFAATLHAVGMPIVKGGAANFIRAFERLLHDSGVDVYTGQLVEKIIVRGGTATGVLAGGEHIAASRAVLASVTPTALYQDLLPPEAVPPVVASQTRSYRYGRAAMQVHVALSTPAAWTDERLAQTPLIHITDGGRQTAISCAQAAAGQLPVSPTIVVGQQHILDPSRVPDGAGSLWIQLQEVPYQPVGDAAGELDVSEGWTESLKRQYVDRVLRILERHAPGLQSQIVGIDILSPADLEHANPNARFGDPYGGSGELDQNLVFRPFPSAAQHATAVRKLWHIGSSTHPGPGLGGGSGYLVSTSLSRRRRW